MARTWWLPGSTSIVSDATPRARAPAISTRIRAEPPPRPGVGHYHADVTRLAAEGSSPVRGHSVPHDAPVGDGDHLVDGAAGASGQDAEQGRPRRDRSEKPLVSALHREPGEEVAEHGQVRRADRPDDRGRRGGGRGYLSSGHEPSLTRFAESVN